MKKKLKKSTPAGREGTKRTKWLLSQRRQQDKMARGPNGKGKLSQDKLFEGECP